MSIPWTAERLTIPGTYLFQRESSSKASLVDVSEVNGALMVWWPNYDQPIENFKGRGYGPIRPSTGPGSR
jgi:hypothetical protein